MSETRYLFAATLRGDYDVVCSLLSQEKSPILNINQKNISGDTALIWASCNGDERVVSLLIERGANLDRQNKVSIIYHLFFSYSN